MAEFISWFQSWTLDGKLAIIFFPFIAFLIYRIARELIKYSEVIIARTRFGSGFVGGVLVGTITSLPEVITEITQATAGTPENGLGDDLGSNTFAFFLLVIGALFYSKRMFLNKLPR